MMESISDLLGLAGRGVVSIMGAGGKTTLMFRLAGELAGKGKRVITTTTTKIYVPDPEQSRHVILSGTAAKLIALAGPVLKTCRHVTAAQGTVHGQNKLKGLRPDQVDTLFGSDLADWIIVEADGARGNPLKACADHEPVIPDSTTHGIVVAGLDCIGKPLDEDWVFRPSLVSEITGVPCGGPVTEICLAGVLFHEVERAGAKRNLPMTVVLNKADSYGLRMSAGRIAETLKKRRSPWLARIVTGSLAPEAQGNDNCGSLLKSPERMSWV